MYYYAERYNTMTMNHSHNSAFSIGLKTIFHEGFDKFRSNNFSLIICEATFFHCYGYLLICLFTYHSTQGGHIIPFIPFFLKVVRLIAYY